MNINMAADNKQWLYIALAGAAGFAVSYFGLHLLHKHGGHHHGHHHHHHHHEGGEHMFPHPGMMFHHHGHGHHHGGFGY